MPELNLPILTKLKAKDINAFIEYWAKLYSYGKEDLYRQNIDVGVFSANNIQKLFEWKNNSKLSGLKQKSLDEKILNRINIINRFKSDINIDVEEYFEEFKSVSTVWKIFLLHIIRPKEYSIYDQHVHRAYNYIKENSIREVKNTINDKVKLNFYREDYLKFVKLIVSGDLKRMDEAFFAFGKILNMDNYKRIII